MADNRSIALPFQTTEGVVTGHVSGAGFKACGQGRNCVVVDAASLGGPASHFCGRRAQAPRASRPICSKRGRISCSMVA